MAPQSFRAPLNSDWIPRQIKPILTPLIDIKGKPRNSLGMIEKIPAQYAYGYSVRSFQNERDRSLWSRGFSPRVLQKPLPQTNDCHVCKPYQRCLSKKKKKRLSQFYVRKILLSIYIHQKIHYCHYLANYEDVTIEDVTSPWLNIKFSSVVL